LERDNKQVTKKHISALIFALAIPLTLHLSVLLPTAGHCADNNKKQLAVLSEQKIESQSSHPVVHVKNQLGAMSEHVSETTHNSINQYLSSMSPAIKAAGQYFANAIKQYGGWLVQYGKQNMSFSPSVKVTPVVEQL